MLASPKLNALPLLRELHLGCSSAESQIFLLDGDDLQLPALTKLVLSNKVDLDSFESLVHLSSLQVLSITMPMSSDAEGPNTNPQDFDALKGFKKLRSLSIETFWVKVEQVQDTSEHNQPCLTKEYWNHLHGKLVHSLDKSSAPMLNVMVYCASRSFNMEHNLEVSNSEVEGAKAGWTFGSILDRNVAMSPNVFNLTCKLLAVEGMAPDVSSLNLLDN